MLSLFRYNTGLTEEIARLAEEVARLTKELEEKDKQIKRYDIETILLGAELGKIKYEKECIVNSVEKLAKQVEGLNVLAERAQKHIAELTQENIRLRGY